MLKAFCSYLKNDEGQTSTEYILLVAVVAIIVFRFRSIAVDKLENLTNSIFDASESKILSELR